MATNVCAVDDSPAAAREVSVTLLAPREWEVLHLLSTGRPYKQIAADLELSMGTVRTYIRRLYSKLRVNCRTEAVVKYMTFSAIGLFSLETYGQRIQYHAADGAAC